VGAGKHFGLYLHHKISVLWDSNNPKYYNKLHKHGAGKRIAQVMGTVPEECERRLTVYFLLLEEKEKKMEAAHNWWIRARAVLSETTSRGEQNPQRRYKLLGHVLFQNAHARCYSCYVWGSKQSSGSQRNQTFHNRANSTTAFNDHDYQKIMNESFGTSFHCINKTSNSTQTQSLFSYCISLLSFRSV
jgi:hypothetical protein